MVGDKFMPEIHSGIKYSACGPFTKNKERIKKIKEIGDSRHIYQNELEKAYFQHDISYGDFRDLNRRTAADKVLRDKAFNIAKNPKYDGYQRGLASMVHNVFDKKLQVVLLKLIFLQNKKLAKELKKSIIRKFEIRKVNSPFIRNIWGADLADIQLISKFNKGFRFYYVLLIFVSTIHGLFL